MFATIHPVPPLDGAGTGPRDVVRALLPAGAQPAGAVLVERAPDAGGILVALWRDEADAPAGERVHRVVDGFDGVATGRTPLFAQLVWVNGAGDPAVARAAERGGRDRIHPAVRDVDGLVGVLVLRSDDHRIVVLTTATAAESLAEVQQRIERTPLLPDEDPTLLPGYDRIELGRVLLADVPEAVRS